MRLDRRSLLAFSGYALVAGLVPVGCALAGEIKALSLVEPVGKASMPWAAYDLMRPVLQQDLGCAVTIETVLGQDGFATINSILTPKAGEVRLATCAVMAAQLAERTMQEQTHIEDLTPIVKLTNGFSVTLFAKRGGQLRTWTDVAAAKSLKVSTMMRASASYLGELMMARKGGIAGEAAMTKGIPDVIEDVVSGRSAVGIVATTYVARQLDVLQPIVSFGAGRNAMLSQTPTFAEVTGNPKLAFTESFGIFGPPKMEPGMAARLTKALVAAGQNRAVADGAEAANIPLAVSGPEVLAETLERNQRVLEGLLG
jgi:tripartite-type tricarboxylate transporter receptor subunit TctC